MKTFDGSYPKAGATISLVYLVGMIAIWFAPETREETSGVSGGKHDAFSPLEIQLAKR